MRSIMDSRLCNVKITYGNLAITNAKFMSSIAQALHECRKLSKNKSKKKVT